MVNGPLTAWRYKEGAGANFDAARGGAALENSGNNEIMTGLAANPGADMTARLLLALTALYTQKPAHDDDEQRHYVELALRLIDRVDAITQATVADMLRGHAAPPAEICDRLGLPQATRAVNCAPPEVPAMAEPAAPAAPAAAQAAVNLATLGEAFFAAPSVAERRQLLALVPSDPNAHADMPGIPSAPEDAELFYAGLDAAALEGRIGELIREFERRLAMPRSLCERIVNDRSGEPMVIAAKAANIPIAVLQRLLLLVNPAVGHSVARVFDLTDLYHDLDRGTAIRLLALWRAEAKPDAAPARAESSERRPPRDHSVAGLRARFGALGERVSRQGVSSRPDPGSADRRDLRSR